MQQDAVVDVALQVGQTTSTVEVADVTPLLQTDSPVLGHVLERKRIEQLPINGRGYQALLATVPGIDATGRVQAYGLRPGSHTLTVDGAASNEVWEGWDFGRPPGLDSIEEFHVEVNNSSAKFTRPTTIVLSSRSGTNQLHGAMFLTNRNSGYGVARRREDNFVKPPFLNRNEFGVSAGGPVFIPKLYNGRNRTFWFFAYEGTRNVTNTTQRWTVPTEAMRNGDFRGLVDSQGRLTTIYDPMTTEPDHLSAPAVRLSRGAEHHRPGADQSDGEVPVQHHAAADAAERQPAGRHQLGRPHAAAHSQRQSRRSASTTAFPTRT